MKNSVVEKILNWKIGLKNSELDNQCKKIGSSKKILGEKVSVKNSSRQIEKIWLLGEEISGQKIGLKNLSWKMDEKISLVGEKIQVRK